MKKLLLLGIMATIMNQAGFAQYSGGVRMGWSYMANCEKAGKKNKTGVYTWNNELFARYTKGKLAFETSFGYYHVGERYTDVNIVNIDDPDYNVTGIKEHSNNIEWNMSAQYDLSCEGMQRCPALRKIKSYVGVLVSPTWYQTTTRTQYVRVDDATVYNTTSSRREFAIWTGITHTLIYTISDAFYLSSSARLQIDPNRLLDHSGISNYPNSRFGLLIGAGYNF